MAARVLQKAQAVLPDLEFKHDPLDQAMRAAAQDLGVKAGQMFQPVRVAVCGRKNAPPLFETLEVLGKEKTLQRIDQALKKLAEAAGTVSPASCRLSRGATRPRTMASSAPLLRTFLATFTLSARSIAEQHTPRKHSFPKFDSKKIRGLSHESSASQQARRKLRGGGSSHTGASERTGSHQS